MTAPRGAEAGKPPRPATGGIRLIVRKPAAAAEEAVAKLSLEEGVAAKKAAAAKAPPPKGPSELYAEVLEAAGGDAGAAAARLKELLAAGSRDAAALGGAALREGVAALHAAGLLAALEKAIGEDSLPMEREAGLAAYAAVAHEGGRPAEPFLLPMLPAVLARHADKVRRPQTLMRTRCDSWRREAARRCGALPLCPMHPHRPSLLGALTGWLLPRPACWPQVKAVREAAAAAGAAQIASMNAHATGAAVRLLLAGTEQGLKWQARAAALGLLEQLAKRNPGVSPRMLRARGWRAAGGSEAA
jgi:hypothetical protein